MPSACPQECKRAFEEGREELEGLTDVDPQVGCLLGRHARPFGPMLSRVCGRRVQLRSRHPGAVLPAV